MAAIDAAVAIHCDGRLASGVAHRAGAGDRLSLVA